MPVLPDRYSNTLSRETAYNASDDVQIMDIANFECRRYWNRPNIQIIAVKNGQISGYINNFDLECCKVTFNGKKVFIPNIDIFVTMTVPEPKTPVGLYNQLKLLSRIHKYQSRGFRIPWNRMTPDGRLDAKDQCLVTSIPRIHGIHTFVQERRKAITTCLCLPCTKSDRRFWDSDPGEDRFVYDGRAAGMGGFDATAD
jgi:hypothetical protein